MDKYKEVPKDQAEFITNLVKTGSPNAVPGSPWLRVYPFNPINMFDNPTLLGKTVAAGILVSGTKAIEVTGLPAQIYACDIVRKDVNIFDTDRYLLSPSGTSLFLKKEIDKNFPEHHTSGIPPWYNLF